MIDDQAIRIEDYEALNHLRPITADPVQLRRPRVIDDVDDDELAGYTVIDPTELDDYLEAVDQALDESTVDDPAFRAFLDDLAELDHEAA